jgi:hypothetical protein
LCRRRHNHDLRHTFAVNNLWSRFARGATLADCGRVLGADHPITLTAHDNIRALTSG